MITAGHGSGRLTSFLEGKQIIGDDEQYAATMALLANAVGVPARVSLDGTVEADGTVYGKDVRADVELDTAEYGWVTLPASQFTGTKSPELQTQKVTPPPQPVKVVPPRRSDAAPVAAANSSSAVSRTAPPPSDVRVRHPRDRVHPAEVRGDAAARPRGGRRRARSRSRRRAAAGGVPPGRRRRGWRVPGASLSTSAVTWASRAAGASASAPTRREFAAHAEEHGLTEARAVAVAADAAVFGPADPDDAAVAAVWQLVAAARRAATSGLPLRRRLWVAVNPVSLWASRATLERLRDAVRSRPAGCPAPAHCTLARARPAARDRVPRPGPHDGQDRTIPGCAYQ